MCINTEISACICVIIPKEKKETTISVFSRVQKDPEHVKYVGA